LNKKLKFKPLYNTSKGLILPKLTIKTRIYFIISVILITACYLQVNAKAALGGYEIADLWVDITNEVKNANALLTQAFKFSQISPFQILNYADFLSTHGDNAVKIINAIKTAGLVVAILLLMVDFFKKTVSFEWSSKWENVLLFLVKVIVIKQVIQNADVILGHIYAGFDWINQQVIGTQPKFIDYGATLTYNRNVPTDFFDNPFLWAVDNTVNFFGGNGNTHSIFYTISPDAVRFFYPSTNFPLVTDPFGFEAPTTGFVPIIERILLQPYFLVMTAISLIIFVIVIGRVFELMIYTIFAPLPLATFAGDGTHDIGKGFIKNYIACVLQITVIGVMFLVYAAVDTYMPNILNGGSYTRLLRFVILISLGLGVMKSGSWSKKICGAG
jgi:hypothetical protein